MSDPRPELTRADVDARIAADQDLIRRSRALAGWRLWGRGVNVVVTPRLRVRVTLWRRFDDRR